MANSKYTKEDFAAQARAQGAGGDLTQDDLTYASANPDGGMALLGYLSDYKKASAAGNDAGAYLARSGIDRIRSGYSGGTPPPASSFSGTQPRSARSYGTGDIKSTLRYMLGHNTAATDANSDGKVNAKDIISMMRSRTPQSASPGSSSSQGASVRSAQPVTPDQYASRYAQLLGGYLDGGVDVGSSDLYREYAKQYGREAQRAADDTLGRLAAASGGRVSSAAASAAAQQQNYYRSQLNDRWMDIYSTLRGEQLQKLQIMQNAEQSAYDRAFAEEARDYNRRISEATLGAEYGDYSGLSKIGIDASRYLENEQYEKKLKEALYAAQYGDYTVLDRMLGTSIAQTAKLDRDYERRMSEATAAAQGGDYTLLDALTGSNVAAIQKEQRDYERAITQKQLALSEQQAAISAAKAASSSGSSSGASSAAKLKDQFVSSLKDADYNRDVLNRLKSGLDYGIIDRDEANYYMGLYSSGYDGEDALKEAIADGADIASTVTEARFKAAKAVGESWAADYETYGSYLLAMVMNGLGLSSALYGVDSFDTAPDTLPYKRGTFHTEMLEAGLARRGK